MSDDGVIHEESPSPHKTRKLSKKGSSEVEVVAEHNSNSDIVEATSVKFGKPVADSDADVYDEHSVKMKSDLGDNVFNPKQEPGKNQNQGELDEKTMFAKA